jgi:phage tail tube protein FII
MSSERPRFIMRNATLWVDRISQIGQASEIGFPSLERKVEEVFNAGMVVPIEVQMGYEMPEVSFKMTSFDPAMLRLFGLAIGTETELMATAATAEMDAHTRGDKAEVSYEYSFRYYKLEIDGSPIYEVDPFNVSIGGVSQTQAERRAMLL